MTWPFGCRGCKAKDSEIGFLRGILSSMRSIVRDAAPQEQRVMMSFPDGMTAQVGTAPAKYEEQGPQHFSRNPIQFADPVKSSNDDAEGVPA